MTIANNPSHSTTRRRKRGGANFDKVRSLLFHIDPDCNYGEWLKVLLAIFHESGGKEEGFELANEWSQQGLKYKGEREIRSKWNSFDLAHPNPVTIATLIQMVRRH